ncbi:hypothetical protein RJT34_02958 [Clitoria ternatea]|uniref:Uncharacterized protein n=1 Tax=Clitoria ternatea TaxID=43366 RepID=A0AAN9Q225_CLITE
MRSSTQGLELDVRVGVSTVWYLCPPSVTHAGTLSIGSFADLENLKNGKGTRDSQVIAAMVGGGRWKRAHQQWQGGHGREGGRHSAHHCHRTRVVEEGGEATNGDAAQRRGELQPTEATAANGGRRGHRENAATRRRQTQSQRRGYGF